MRSIWVVATVFGVALAPGAFAASPAMMRGSCVLTPGEPINPLPSKANAVELLGSVTQLLSPLGVPVLTSNLATTVAINNDATPALRAQAVHDAQVTAANANTLADGLGATMGSIYRAKADFSSNDDGKTHEAGQIGPKVAALIAAVGTIAGGDSGEGKCAFANGVEPFQAKTYALPPHGVYDVLGKAYGHPAGSPGADKYGDVRPFQAAPVGAASGSSIQTYGDVDFFGVKTNSRNLLTGATEAEKAAGQTGSDLTNSPAFPSGHTTFAYTEALLLALMVPERYRGIVYRASEYGNSRIVLGAHYAVDVIGGRTLATYDLAQDLAGTSGYAKGAGSSLRATLAAAAAELREYLQQNGCPRIAACAARDPIVRAHDASVLTKAGFQPAGTGEAYAFRLNYGLATMGRDDLPSEPVPVEAGYLLATRFPYLTRAQRLDVLLSTEGPSGHFLDASPITGASLLAGPPGPQAEVGAYSRLDLYAAAGGYASFAKQVTVDQDEAAMTDPDLQPFAEFAHADTWSNDIGGPGGLTKRGAGTLTLTGRDTYAGSTRVEGGTLEIDGSLTGATKVAAGGTLSGQGKVGDVSVEQNGTLASGAPDGPGMLEIEGSLELAPNAAYLVRARPDDGGALRVMGAAKLDGARLVVSAGEQLRPGARLTILTARGGVSGTFGSVAIKPPSLGGQLTYAANAVYLTVERGGAASPN